MSHTLSLRKPLIQMMSCSLCCSFGHHETRSVSLRKHPESPSSGGMQYTTKWLGAKYKLNVVCVTSIASGCKAREKRGDNEVWDLDPMFGTSEPSGCGELYHRGIHNLVVVGR
jgi:hypothetical protein